mgnify:CR=1 FL=1
MLLGHFLLSPMVVLAMAFFITLNERSVYKGDRS